MSFAIATVDRSATRACLARVARVDCDYRQSSPSRLVRHELAKLGKTPGVQTVALALSGPNTLANMGQVFDRNREALAFSPRNNLLGYAVVHVFAKVGFLLREFLQSTLGSFRAAPLQASLALGQIRSERFDADASISTPLAVKRDVDDAEINAENTFNVDLFRVWYIANASDVPLSLDDHQIDFALAKRQQLALPIAANERDFLTSRHRPDRNDIAEFEGKDAVVERLARMLAKRHHLRLAAVRLVRYVRIRDLGDAANGNLRGDAKPLARVMVCHFVQVELTNGTGFKATLGHPVASVVATLKRFREQLCLLFRRLQLDVGDQFHSSIMDEAVVSVNDLRASARTPIPHRPKGRCFSEKRR